MKRLTFLKRGSVSPKIQQYIKMAKVLGIFLLVGCLQANAANYASSKRLNFELQNASLKEVFDAIEKQSEFTIFYKQDDVDLNQRFSYQAYDKLVSEVLEDVLDKDKLTYEVKDKVIVIYSHDMANASMQQEVIVTGRVIDTQGFALPGVNVFEKSNPTRGVITDMDGNYSINSPSEGVLVFSFIGFNTQEVAIAGQTTINITMVDEVTDLDEVVVTALGIKRETKALGYAVTDLKGDDLNKNVINPVNALQGRAAGVDISQSDGGMFGSSRILIRGASTLKPDNQPIYVIDGVILDNNHADVGDADWSSTAGDFGSELKNLNPDDFESISVLKGAAATALYGSRGLNGAIVITTKSGENSQGLGVSVNQTFGIDYVYRQPDLQNVYGDGALSGYVDYGETNSSGGYYQWQNQEQFYLNTNGDAKFNNWQMGYGPRFDGRSILGYDNKLTNYNAVDNNYRDMYDLGFNSNTNISVQGGNEKTTFYTSMSYRHANGTLGKNEFDRLSFLAKASHQLNDHVLVEASINFANSTPKNPQPNIGEYFTSGVLGREYDPDYYKDKYKGTHGGLANGNYGDEYASVPGIGLWWALNENSDIQHETSVRPYLGLTVDLTTWLKLKAEANYNYYFTDREIKNPNSGYARTYDSGAGQYAMIQTTKKQTNASASFLYNKNLTDDLVLSGFLRGDYYDNKQTYMSNSTNGGLVVPDQYFINNSVNSVSYNSYVTGYKRILSTSAAINLAWRSQIYLDITGRNDWSSALVYADQTGNNSYFYPSVSLSGIVSEMVDLPTWISFGKVRASWAQVGNDTNPYDINTAYSLNTSSQNGSNVNSLVLDSQMTSLDIKPERKNSWEVGLDWRFFSSRIGIDATYYKENTKNQIMTIDVPSVSGVNQQLVNAGNIQNQGVEIALNTTPIKTADWRWDVDFTYTRNESKIISLHENVADYILLSGYTNYGNYRIGSVAKVGGEYGMLITDSKPMIDDATGLPVLTYSDTRRMAFQQRSGEEEELGSIQPDFLGGLRTTLSYKNVSLTAGFDMRFGGMVASYGAKYGTAYGYTEASLRYSAPEYGGITWTSSYDGIQYQDGYVPNGLLTAGTNITQANGTVYTVVEGGESYQSLYERGILEPVHASAWHYWNNSWGYGTTNSDWVKDLNYIALREVTVSYRCPGLADKLSLKGLSFSLSGYNLGYLLNNAPAGVNPESVRGTTPSNFRMRSFAAYTANYMFSINAKF